MTSVVRIRSAIRKRRATLRELLDRALGWLWSYDFFISYARDDGTDYPQALYRALDEHYRVFLDSQGGFQVGDHLKFVTRQRVVNSAYLVVVGKHHALTESEWVAHEAELYLQRQLVSGTRRAPLIIDVCDALDHAASITARRGRLINHADLPHWLRVSETQPDSPSATVLEQINASFKARRADSRRARALQFVAILLATLLAGSIVLAVVADRARESAQRSLMQSYVTQAQAAAQDSRHRQAAAYAVAALEINDNAISRQLLLENPFARLISRFELPDATISAVAIAANGLAAIGDERGRLTLLLPAGEHGESRFRGYQAGHNRLVEMAFSASGSRLAVSNDIGEIWFLDLSRASDFKLLDRLQPADQPGPQDIDRSLGFATENSLVVEDVTASRVAVAVFNVQDFSATKLALADGDGTIWQIASHPTKPLQAVLLASGAIHLLDFRTTPSSRLFVDDIDPSIALHSARASSIAFVPAAGFRWSDGAASWSLLAGSDDARLFVFDSTGTQQAKLRFPRRAASVPAQNVVSVFAGPEGWRIAGLRADGTLMTQHRGASRQRWEPERVFDSASGTRSASDTPLLSCCSANGVALVTGSGSGTLNDDRAVYFWDLAGNENNWRLTLQGKYASADASLTSLAFDATGRYLVAGTDSNQTVVLDRQISQPAALSTGERWRQNVGTAKFHPHGSVPTVAIASWNGPPILWDLGSCTSTELRHTVVEDQDLNTLDWSADGRQLFIVSYTVDEGSFLKRYGVTRNQSGQLRLSTKPTAEAFIDHALVNQVVAIGEGNTLLLYEQDGDRLYSWLAASGQPRSYALRSAGGITGISASPDGRRVMVSSADGFELWHHEHGELTFQSEVPCDDSPCGGKQAMLSRDGNWFAFESTDAVYIRQIDTGLTLAKLDPGAGQIDKLALSADNTALAAGSWSGDVIVWDVTPVTAAVGQLQNNLARRADLTLQQGVLQPVGLDWPWQFDATLSLPPQPAALRFDQHRYRADELVPAACATALAGDSR